MGKNAKLTIVEVSLRYTSVSFIRLKLKLNIVMSRQNTSYPQANSPPTLSISPESTSTEWSQRQSRSTSKSTPWRIPVKIPLPHFHRRRQQRLPFVKESRDALRRNSRMGITRIWELGFLLLFRSTWSRVSRFGGIVRMGFWAWGRILLRSSSIRMCCFLYGLDGTDVVFS